MSKTIGAVPVVNTDGSTFTQSAFFDTLVTGAAKGVSLPQTATIPSSVPACKFWWDAALNVTGVSSGGNVTGSSLPTQIGGTLTAGASSPVFYNDSTAPNGLAYVRFAGNTTSNLIANTFTLASWSGLNGVWAMVYVVRINNWSIGYANLGGWYDSVASQWARLLVGGYFEAQTRILAEITNNLGDNILGADMGPPVPNSGFAVVSMYSDGTDVHLRINGVPQLVTGDNLALGVFAMSGSTPLVLGGLPVAGGAAFDEAAYVQMDSTTTLSSLQGVENYLMQRFGFGSQQPLLGNPNLSVARNLVVMGNNSYDTQPAFVDCDGDTTWPANWPLFQTNANKATLTVEGAISARGYYGQSHNLRAWNVTGGNVASIWEESGGGFSALVTRGPGFSAGAGYYGGFPNGTFGTGHPAVFPWSAPNTGSAFIEFFNGVGSTYPAPDMRFVQTSNDAYGPVLRSTWTAETRAIVDLDTSYSLDVGGAGSQNATVTFTVSAGAINAVTTTPASGGTTYPASTSFPLAVTGGGGTGGIVLAYTNSSGAITSFASVPLAGGSGYTGTTGAATSHMVDKPVGSPWQGLCALRGAPGQLIAASGGSFNTQIPQSYVGLIFVKDLTNLVGAIYAVANGAIITTVSANAEFSALGLGTALHVNTGVSGGQWVVQNETAAALVLTAGCIGG